MARKKASVLMIEGVKFFISLGGEVVWCGRLGGSRRGSNVDVEPPVPNQLKTLHTSALMGAGSC